MKLVSIKSASEFPIKGIKVEFVKEDGNLKRVELSDGNGGHAVITYEAYSSLKVMVPQEHEKVDRYKLSGTFMDVAPITEFFESDWEAKAKLREYEEKAGNRDCGLKVEKIAVLVDDDGAVVKEAT